MSARNSFIQIASGHAIDPLNPDPKLIKLNDIAHSLALQCRYTGHTKTHYSVAEHSVRASKINEHQGTYVAIWKLLHDAPETYIGDLASPLKGDPAFGQRFRGAEARLMRAVCDAFGLDYTQPEGVQEADLIMLATEVRDLMPRDLDQVWGSWLQELTPLPERIRPWTWQRAKKRFIDRYAVLSERLKEER